MNKFQGSTCKIVGEQLQTKLCTQTEGWTDGQTAMAIPVYPLHFVVGGIIKVRPETRALHAGANAQLYCILS